MIKLKIGLSLQPVDLKERNINKSNLNRHPWELARLDLIHTLMGPLLKKKAEPLILDIGSGDLFVADSLAQEFSTAIFFCIDKEYGNEAMQVPGNIKTFSSIENVQQELIRPADVVLLLDVLEHIEDEIVFLKNLLSNPFINNQTIMVITVPAFNSLSTSHDEYLGHLRRYNLKMAKERFGGAGLRVESSSYFFFSLLLPRFFKKMGEKVFGKSQKFEGVGNWKGGGLITGVITAFLKMDNAFCRILNKAGIHLPGLSLYIICRKPA